MSDPRVVRVPGPDIHIPRILFAGRDDWANLCNRITRGINAFAGRQVARVWTENTHPFGYVEDMVGMGALEEAREFVKTADWIISIGDGNYDTFAGALLHLRYWDTPVSRRPHLAVTHAGTAFRQNPERYNEYDKELKPLIRFVGADSLHLVGEGGAIVAPYWSTSDTIEIAEYPPPFDIEHENLVVAHSPSNRNKKGTEAIIQAIRNVEADDYYKDVCKLELIEGVSYQEALARRAKAHVFVDQLNPEVGGFGCSAIEAMAAGCVVIADVRNTPADWEIWNSYNVEPPPIIHIESPDEIEENLYGFMENPGNLHACRAISLDWAREWAAPMQVGRYFVQKLNMAVSKHVWECFGCGATQRGIRPVGWVEWPVPRGRLLMVCNPMCGVAAEKKALDTLRANFEATAAAQEAAI